MSHTNNKYIIVEIHEDLKKLNKMVKSKWFVIQRQQKNEAVLTGLPEMIKSK